MGTVNASADNPQANPCGLMAIWARQQLLYEGLRSLDATDEGAIAISAPVSSILKKDYEA